MRGRSKMYQARFTKLIFRLQLLQAGNLPKYKASAIRGGMGQMLLTQNCFWQQKQCEECMLQPSCIVQNVMYAKYKRKPDFVTEESMGFVLDCIDKKEHYEKGEEVSFALTLFGETISYFTPIVYAITALGNAGIGKEKIPFIIASIENRKGEKILENGNIYMQHITIETLHNYIKERKQNHTFQGKIKFLSPVTIKYRKEFIRKLQPEAILENINRRIFMLNCFEGYEMELNRLDLSGLKLCSEKSHPAVVKRYSNTKQDKMLLHGIEGEIQIDGLNEQLEQMLIAGEILHIGKNTRFGFGKYEFS